ncbi:MAG: 4-phosphopantetheinyl transferase family protein, partial [Erysipelotrichaceae bacterium]|nr:4-phosphopantetheinyl transferase family protein [Erysipelotrichaceae bacterium]
IDAEKIRKTNAALKSRVCTSFEQKYLSACSEASGNELFIRMWTVKESFMKLLGSGLSAGAAQIETSFTEPERVLYKMEPADVFFKTWKMEDCWITCALQNPDRIQIIYADPDSIRALFLPEVHSV